MAMVISPKSKIITVIILICIIILVAMIIFGFASILENTEDQQSEHNQLLSISAKTMSSKHQHLNSYKNVSFYFNYP